MNDTMEPAGLSDLVQSASYLQEEEKDLFKNFTEDFRIVPFCNKYSLQPDFRSYWTAILPYSVWLFWLPLLGVVATCLASAAGARTAWRRRRAHMPSVIVVFAMYPAVSLAALATVALPRSRLVCEALSQQAVMAAIYHVVCLLLDEGADTEQLMRERAEERVAMRVPPCCCWPCCLLPSPHVTRRSLIALQLLVAQMSLVQGLIYVTQLILAAEDYGLFQRSFIYFQPLVVASILFGVWGATMVVRLARLAGRAPAPRLLSVQMALLVVKLQCGIAKVAPEFWAPCILPINPYVFANLVHNCLTVFEMLALSLWAWALYSNLTEDSKIDNSETRSDIDKGNPKFKTNAAGGAGIDNKTFDNRTERL